MRKFLSAMLAVLLAIPAVAGTIRFDRGGLNARSSLSFRGTRNILTTVPKGTTGEILERWKLPSGNFGIKLKIQTVGSAGTSLREGEEIWVYYHKDTDLRRVAVVDDAGVELEIDDPAGQWAVALSTFKTRRQETTAAAPCTDCGIDSPEVLPLTNAQEVVDVVEEITEAVDEAPVLEVGEQEMLSYVNQIVDSQRKGPLTAEERENNKSLVQSLLKECRERNVSVTLALALLQAESEFKSSAVSKKKARGPMQVMPDTYHWLLEKMKLPPDPKMKRIHEPAQSIRLGIWYLSYMLRKYDGNEKLAVQAYNCGDGRMDDYLAGKKKTLPGETVRHWEKIRLHMKSYAAFQEKSRTLIAAN